MKMDTETQFITLSAKSLSGELTRDEELLFLKGLEQADNVLWYDDLRRRWDDLADDRSRNVAHDVVHYTGIIRKIRRAEPKFARPETNRPATKVVWRVAASLLLVCVLGISTSNTPYSAEPESMSRYAQAGQQHMIALGEQGSVVLNSESELKQEEALRGGQKVSLSGEAYFSVSHNHEVPLIVHTKDLEIKATDAEFNVKAFSDEHEVTISQVQGSTNILDKRSGTTVTLYAGDALVYNKVSGTYAVRNFSWAENVGWKENILIFEMQPLEKVLRTLERHYDINVVVKNRRIKHCPVSLRVAHATIYTVLESLRAAGDFNYAFQDERTVVVSGKGCK